MTQRWLEEEEMSDLFQALENDVAVDRLTYRGLDVWPVVRGLLFNLFWCSPPGDGIGDHDVRASGLRTALEEFAVRWDARPEPALLARNRLMRHRQRMGELDRLAPGSVLFFSAREDNHGRIAGLPYNTILDPIMERAARRWPVSRLELGAAEPRFHPTQFSDAAPWMLADLAREPAFEADADIPGFAQLSAALSRRIGVPVGERAFIDGIWRVWSLHRFFMDVLARLKPRAVFLIGYYQLRGFALAAACRRMGIPLVNLQHGMQGRRHGLYTGFHRLPADGFNTIPDFFWVWGPSFAQVIASTPPFGTAVHRPLIGGHPWFSYWADRDAAHLGSEEASAFLERVGRWRQRILVSLQPFAPGSAIPAALKECIREPSGDRFWMIRRHPVMAQSVEELEAELEAEGLGNVDVRLSSTLPLPLLLRSANRHVTRYSSTAHEAAAYGIATVSVDPQAAFYLQDLLDEGSCTIAGSPQPLQDALDADREQGMGTLPQRIVFGPELIDSALDMVIGPATAAAAPSA